MPKIFDLILIGTGSAASGVASRCRNSRDGYAQGPDAPTCSARAVAHYTM